MNATREATEWGPWAVSADEIGRVTTKRALVLAFVANGLGGPSFLARLPERQRDLELSDAGLGLVVLGLAFGALVASTGAAWAVRRYGSRNVTTAAGVTIGATLWLTAAPPPPPRSSVPWRSSVPPTRPWTSP